MGEAFDIKRSQTLLPFLNNADVHSVLGLVLNLALVAVKEEHRAHIIVRLVYFKFRSFLILECLIEESLRFLVSCE